MVDWAFHLWADRQNLDRSVAGSLRRAVVEVLVAEVRVVVAACL